MCIIYIYIYIYTYVCSVPAGAATSFFNGCHHQQTLITLTFVYHTCTNNTHHCKYKLPAGAAAAAPRREARARLGDGLLRVERVLIMILLLIINDTNNINKSNTNNHTNNNHSIIITLSLSY